MSDEATTRGPQRCAHAVGLVAATVLAAAAATAGLPSSLDLGLEATVEQAWYLHPGDPGSRFLGTLKGRALWAPVSWGEAETTFALRADSDGEIDRRVAPDWRERSLAPRALEVRELKLAAHTSGADLMVGKLVAAWGVGDLLQPTDAVTPRDLTDPLRESRLGAWGATVEVYPGASDLTLAVVRHAPLRLPAADRRWFPVATPAPLQLSPHLPTGRGAWIAALRLAGSGRGFDWALVARRGPDLAPHAGTVDGLRVGLRYPDMTLLGGSFSTARGPLVLRAEAAWRRYDRGGGRPDEDFITVISGIERRFPALLFGRDGTLIAEIVHEHHTGGPHLPREIAVLDPMRLFLTGLSVRLLLHDPTGWEGEVGVVTDLEAGGGLFQVLVRRNISDRIDLEVSADFLTAGGNPALAPVAANDRLTARLVVRF